MNPKSDKDFKEPNYIRPHEALDGKTPSEACGITIEGKNKWLTLIQNASQQTKREQNNT